VRSGAATHHRLEPPRRVCQLPDPEGEVEVVAHRRGLCLRREHFHGVRRANDTRVDRARRPRNSPGYTYLTLR